MRHDCDLLVLPLSVIPVNLTLFEPNYFRKGYDERDSVVECGSPLPLSHLFFRYFLSRHSQATADVV
jgi:hypothetical protein